MRYAFGFPRLTNDLKDRVCLTPNPIQPDLLVQNERKTYSFSCPYWQFSDVGPQISILEGLDTHFPPSLMREADGWTTGGLLSRTNSFVVFSTVEAPKITYLYIHLAYIACAFSLMMFWIVLRLLAFLVQLLFYICPIS